jgi:ABC-type bacteriocin/lantibiotic exporter with double-glycine peptidase domain
LLFYVLLKVAVAYKVDLSQSMMQGERGVNLSGGQKARVSLARACYSSSKVVLLDDPLAAVDVPTARHLMDNVLGGVLKGRTVILVTHNKSALELCDKVFLMHDGKLEVTGLEEDVLQDVLRDNENKMLEQQYTGTNKNFLLSFKLQSWLRTIYDMNSFLSVK